MGEKRLIERWLPIAEIGIESLRERVPMTPFPAPNRLHVWWARRPLVCSRAAILASLLRADVDRSTFLKLIGVLGDPMAAKRRIAEANRTGKRLGAGAYGYSRAFTYAPTPEEWKWVADNTLKNAVVLDPTAGGGSIPFESERLGLSSYGNDLNPVAALILSATTVYPAKFGAQVAKEFAALGERFVHPVREALCTLFPEEDENTRPDGYIYARTVKCPYCDGLVPLSPNWRLASDGTGVRLVPQTQKGTGSAGRVCRFEIVHTPADHSEGSVSGGDARCPFPDCLQVIDGDEIKRQAQHGGMGEQLYTIVIKRRIEIPQKNGKIKIKWERDYRAPRITDDNSAAIQTRLAEMLPVWEATDIVPNEDVPDGLKTTEPIRYGMTTWKSMFSPRQLLCHGTSVEIYRAMLEEDRLAGELTDIRKAAYVYLAFSLDKLRDYNSRMTHWHSTRSVVAGTFDRHDFAFKWSYVEMAALVTGLGYDWAITQTEKCIGELAHLIRPGDKKDSIPKKLKSDRIPFPVAPGGDTPEPPAFVPPPMTITCKSGDHLDHIADGTVDAVVMDPPYYDNVMYAELSDFFYVWLKRTVGYIDRDMGTFFRRALTDKDHEAVANPSRFKGQKGATALAGRDYQGRMAAIFTECRRVLKSDGILTLMFTHKATGAWDALTKGLMAAGFVITASWPVNTEAEGSLHIKDKSAANSTILLVCRPREERDEDSEIHYWEDVEVEVAKAVRKRVGEFQEAGITGVDLYLASFGPALEKFSEYWPLQRGTPRLEEETKKRKKQAALFEEEVDPYAVTPEDALTAARREVKQWRLEQLTHKKTLAEMDPITAWFVLAWDAFKASTFPYDEGLRLARAVGVDLERDIIGYLAKKKASDLVLFDSKERATKTLGPADGSRAMIDALHFAAYTIRTKNTEAARELLERNGLLDEPAFHTALQAVLEVLPVSKSFTKIDVPKAAEGASSDFEALENLRKLAFTEHVQEPEQLKLALKPAGESGLTPEGTVDPGGTANLL